MSSRPSIVSTAVLAASLALLVAACGGGGSSPTSAAAPASAAQSAAAPASAAGSAAAPASAAGSSVTIQNFAFGPSTVTVPVGGTVIWTNGDSTQHTVTADDGSFSSDPLASGQTFSRTFTSAGTFTYHCKIHPTMKATVTVG